MEFLWDDNATGKQNKTMDVREGWHEPQGDGRKKKLLSRSSLRVVVNKFALDGLVQF